MFASEPPPGDLKLPTGFTYAGVRAGLKVKRLDFGLVLSDRPATAAGCLTRSMTPASCIARARASLPRESARAIAVTSGNANCFAGPDEAANDRRIAAAIARAVGVAADDVLTFATGPIGIPMPIATVEAAVPKLVGGLSDHPHDAARAMLTTDTVTKLSSRELFLGGRRVRILGIAKGSGMVHPDLATVLGFLLTDAAIEPAVLQSLLRAAVDDSFNMLSVDAATSTNDAVVAMANGASDPYEPDEDESGILDDATSPDALRFGEALGSVCTDLAIAVASDGEGARKLVTVRLRGAPTAPIARGLARAPIESALVKAALFGAEPGWGRVVAALGARAVGLGFAIDRTRVDIALQGVHVVRGGLLQKFDRDALRVRLRSDDVVIEIDLGLGPCGATAWGCDLSYDYVRINADYAAVLADSPEGPVKLDTSLERKSPDLKAEVLVEALRYIERFQNTRAVIRLGGRALLHPQLLARLAEDVRLLRAAGLSIVLVHAHGAELASSPDLGTSDLVPKWESGDAELVQLALTSQVNDGVVAALARAGARAVGLSGKDGDLLVAGGNGDIQRVDVDVVDLLLGRGYVPVVSPAALGPDGRTRQVDADLAAAAIAVACGAKKLIVLSDARGIEIEGHLVSEISAEELRERIEAHEAQQVDDDRALTQRERAALRALSGGVDSIHLIDGRVPHQVVAELFTATGVGTMIRLAPQTDDGA